MILDSPVPAAVPKSILFVDDDEGMRAAIYHAFSYCYRVILAVDGLDGYAKARAQPRLDLVVTDVVMPGLDGVNMARRIRENEAFRAVPVVFLSGQALPLDLLVGPPLGLPFIHLSKTTHPLVLRRTVERVLGGD